jgi:hypothetical protein
VPVTLPAEYCKLLEPVPLEVLKKFVERDRPIPPERFAEKAKRPVWEVKIMDADSASVEELE